MTTETIVVFEGIICKWGTLKGHIPAELVTFANADEVRAYFMMKLR